MRVGVIGLGAIGGVVAQRLTERGGGDEIALAAGRHADAIRAHGLGGSRSGGGARCPAGGVTGSVADGAGGSAGGASALFSVAETLPRAPFDVVLLCTRTDDTGAALSGVTLAPGGSVVCLQNGLPEEAAARVVGAGRVLGAVIGWSASASMAPVPAFCVTGGGKFTLGAFSPEAAQGLPRATALLERAFPVRVTKNLAGARWSKLAMNCAMSTLGAVSGLDLGQLAARADAREAALRVMAEVIAVGRARGVAFEPIAGIRPDLLLRLPRAIQHASVWLAARRRPRQRSGMLVRLLEGRTAGQVDDLNGLVARLGPAPLNARLVALVHAIERGEERIVPGHLASLLP